MTRSASTGKSTILGVLIVLNCVAAHCSTANAIEQTEATAVQDLWYTVRFNGDPVGYEHITSGPEDDNVAAVRLCCRKTRLKLKRLGQDLSVEATLTTRQTPEGQLLSFDLQRVDGDGSRIERSGKFDPVRRAFQVSERVRATRRTVETRVSGPVYSPVITTWLPQKVMNERRIVSLPVFFPESGAIADLHSELKTGRTLRLTSGQSAETHRIQFYPIQDATRTTTLFVDSDLVVLRQEQRILGGTLTLEAGTVEEALTFAAEKSLDLDTSALIPIDRMIKRSQEATKLILDLTVTNGFLADIPNTVFQKTQRIEPSTIRITVVPSTPPRGRASAIRAEPKDEKHLRSTRWMPLEDPLLQKMAAIGAGSKTDAFEICQQLESYVQTKMKYSRFSTSILPADEVARNLRGDCTEHAVLLAALMRQKGIPSRLATGLIHTDRLLGFTGHAWVEAKIGEQWVPFDSSLGKSRLNSTHIKLTDSDLPDGLMNGAVLFTPVLDLAGRASVRVVSGN